MLEIIRKQGTAQEPQHNFSATTVVINGGLECPSSAQATRRYDYFTEFGKLFGIEDDQYYKNTMATSPCCNNCINEAGNGANVYYESNGNGCKTVYWQTPFLVNDASHMGYKMCLEEYSR